LSFEVVQWVAAPEPDKPAEEKSSKLPVAPKPLSSRSTWQILTREGN
jgi:hypothetical protein